MPTLALVLWGAAIAVALGFYLLCRLDDYFERKYVSGSPHQGRIRGRRRGIGRHLNTPRLHVIYRSTGAEGAKDRPSYYSKTLALQTFLSALRNVPALGDVVFLNDGSVPDDRLTLMRRNGWVVQIHAGSNRGSYLHALRLAGMLWRRPEDMVWFAEDDYLYEPDALRTLQFATDGEYYALYGANFLTAGLPGWRPILSTTSTFGLRIRAFRRDRGLLRLCPWAGEDWDHTTCLALQGLQHFTIAQLLAELVPLRLPFREWPRSIARGFMRSLVTVRSHRRVKNRRQLIGHDPMLIWHMEAAPNEDPRWARLAERTRTLSKC